MQKGGLDQYLLETPANLLGHEGMRLRQLALDAQRVKEGHNSLPKLELLSPEECRAEKRRIAQEKYDARIRALHGEPSYALVRRARELAARAFGVDSNPMPGEEGLARYSSRFLHSCSSSHLCVYSSVRKQPLPG